MACGTPVVAFDVGGLRDVIGDSDGGILVPGRDVELLADSIESMVQDDTKRREMSERAADRVRRLFSLPRHTHECVSRYEHAIERLG